MKQRREWYKMYQEGLLPLEGLRRVAPLLAAAVEKKLAAKAQASQAPAAGGG